MELINGIHSNNEALRIISDLIQVKINFHEEKISQSDIDEDIKMRQARIKELQNDLASLKKYLLSFEDNLNIRAQIHMNRKNEPGSSFKIIDGAFTPSEAKQILTDAYRSKIAFHTNSAFSKVEKGESGTELHEKRIEELKKDISVINQIVQSAERTCSILHINCKIEIHVEEPLLVLSKQTIGLNN